MTDAEGANTKERLRILINRTLYSDKAFAKSVGLSPTFLSGILSGKKNLPPKRAAEIAQKYHVSLDWLLHGKGKMELWNYQKRGFHIMAGGPISILQLSDTETNKLFGGDFEGLPEGMKKAFISSIKRLIATTKYLIIFDNLLTFLMSNQTDSLSIEDSILEISESFPDFFNSLDLEKRKKVAKYLQYFDYFVRPDTKNPPITDLEKIML